MSEFMAQFHFLRPFWLLGLLVLPLLFWLIHQTKQQPSSWHQNIQPQLLKHLLDDQQTPTQRWPFLLFIIGLGVTFIALAGPAWKKLPQPVHKPEDALVIVLDQSLSMLATDQKPSRLIAVRHKLTDLLKARRQGQTALIVYAGDAHTVSPLTDDSQTILSIIPALSPLIMPALGSRVESGIALAVDTLQQSGIDQGRILLITDGIEDNDIPLISKQLNKHHHKLSILSIGSADGGPIPISQQGLLRDKGEIVIATTDFSRLQQLAVATGALIAPLSLNDADLSRLLPAKGLALKKTSRQVDREVDQWQEEGPWLILLLLPVAALAFRRGWLLSLLLIITVQPQFAEANEGGSLWLNKDQQAVKAYNSEQYQRAQQIFQNPHWQASAAYRAGDYQAAAELFAQSDDAQAHYNRGNALAKMGQFEEAIKAYQQALTRNPNLNDAKFNQTLVKRLAEQQKQQQPSDAGEQKNNGEDTQQTEPEQQNQQNQEQEQSQQSQQRQQRQQRQQQSSEQQSRQAEQPSPSAENNGQQTSKQPDDIDQDNANHEAGASTQEHAQPEPAVEQEQEREENAADPQKSQTLSDSLSAEEQQAIEQWLRRIPDDPGALLRRKFNYQYQINRQNNQYLPQQEDEPTW